MCPPPVSPGQSGGVSIPGTVGDVAGSIVGGNMVIVYQAAAPVPVDEATLAQAEALLARLPLDAVPPRAGLPAGSWLPLRRNALFVGREPDLQKLAATLKAGGTAAVGQSTAVTGMGGIGKSQLACEFAWRYGSYFAGGVFWLGCADPAAIPAEIATCGRGLNLHAGFSGLKLGEQVSLVAQAWHSQLPRLLIFDNCEDEAVLEDWPPRGGGCRVLVTARRGTWSPELGVQAISLGTMTRTESVALLRRHRPELAADDPDLDAIAAELGDLPLALHLAGTYLALGLHEAFGRPAAYLAAVRRPDLLQHQSLALKGRSPTGHEQHVARTFALSWQQLDPAVTADTIVRTILARAAWFGAGEPIPRELLRASAGVEDQDEAAAAEFARGLVRVDELGLATPPQEGALVLHRLVAAFIRGVNDTNVNEAARAAVEQAVATEARSINDYGDPRPLLTWQPQLRAVAEAATRDGRAAAATLLNELGIHLRMVAEFAGARAAFERALAIDERAYGPDHPKVARDVNNLGNVLRDQGDLTGARAAFERALAIDERAYGPDHLNVAIGLNNLGTVLQDQSDLPGARAAYERALEIDERAYGPDHLNVAIRLNNLGTVLQDQGDLPGARAAFERALAIDERAYGPDHLNVAIRLNNLGDVLQDQADLAGARAAFERALAIDERVLGPNHPDVARDVYNLGRVLRVQGDLAGAKAAFERALPIFRNRLGEQHPHTDSARQALEAMASSIDEPGPS